MNRRSKMNEKKDFDIFWKELTQTLAIKQKIKNWTEDHEYIGEDFSAIYISAPHRIEGGYIEITPKSALQTQKVKKHSFKKIYPYWEQYTNGKFERSFFVDKKKNSNATRHSKYIISILHQFENLMTK